LIIDQKTTEQVIAARPLVPGMEVAFVPELVKLLLEHSSEDNQELSIDKRVFWLMSVGDMVVELQKRGFAVSSQKVGRATKSLGLDRIRRNYGILVFWSREQLDILAEYFELEGES